MAYGKFLNQKDFSNWEDRWKASWRPKAEVDPDNQYDDSLTLGGVPIWRLQQKFGPGMRSNSGVLADPQPVPGMLSKMGNWAGDHPMDAVVIIK